jgi:hypothetical protein
MIEQTRCCGTLRTAWRFEKVDDVKISQFFKITNA